MFARRGDHSVDAVESVVAIDRMCSNQLSTERAVAVVAVFVVVVVVWVVVVFGRM